MVGRTQATPLDIVCEEEEYTLDQYQAKLQKLHAANSSNGGLQPVCKVCFAPLIGLPLSIRLHSV